MLPDFTLPVTVGGRRARLLARDVPAAVFWLDFPDVLPGTPCYEAATTTEQAAINLAVERWRLGLLTRVVIQPRLTLELAHRLGPAGDEAAKVYFRRIGWLPGVAGIDEGPAPWLQPVRTEPEALELASEVLLRALATPPGPNLMAELRLLAGRARTRPSTLWALPISEWLFDYRVLIEEERRRRGEPGVVLHEDFRAIGLEED